MVEVTCNDERQPRLEQLGQTPHTANGLRVEQKIALLEHRDQDTEDDTVILVSLEYPSPIDKALHLGSELTYLLSLLLWLHVGHLEEFLRYHLQ
jgi:hypothetical protein